MEVSVKRGSTVIRCINIIHIPYYTFVRYSFDECYEYKLITKGSIFMDLEFY